MTDQDFSEAINDAIYANSSRMEPTEFEAVFDTLCRTTERKLLKPVQDMSLRELFDHVAIVNDAIRAALLTHPGMTSVVTHEDAGTAHDPHAVGYERQGRR